MLQFTGCVYAYVILLTFLGPEEKGRDMGVVYDEDFKQAAGFDSSKQIELGNSV